MILLSSLLSETRTASDISVSSKKNLLETIASLFAEELNLNSKALFKLLFEREQLSSTGMGKGFALPHARTEGITQAYGCLLHLVEPVQFDAIDNQPIDLVFAVIVPTEANSEHLNILASIAKTFSDPTTCKALRAAKDSLDMLSIIEQKQVKD